MLSLITILCILCPFSTQSNLEFSIEPRSIIVREGSPAILNCQTKLQTKDVYISWKKGSVWVDTLPLNTNNSYTQLRNNSLYFPSIRKNDEDTYMCGAFIRNTKERHCSRVAYITLAYIDPNFISNPSGQVIREFNITTLTCISGASQPLPKVTWEKDGQPIINNKIMAQHYITNLNATSGSLQLKNVSLSDAGYYSCVATNPILLDMPRRSLKALLLVLPKDDKPRIEVHPVNRLSPVQRPFQMHCVIVGVPPPVIYWIKDGTNVTNSSDGQRQVFLNGTFNIKSLAVKDNGQYSCVGFNDKGSVASSKVFLIVAYIDYTFNQNPENKTVVNGSEVEMVCKPPYHFPTQISFKWYKEYRAITVGGRLKILPTGSLFFNPVLKSDQGVYFCEAYNPASYQTRSSTVGYLMVHVPPYFLSTPSSQTVVILYNQLRLSCSFSGSPSPTLVWYHDNTLLSNSSTSRILTNGSLTLPQVKASDAGVYKCLIWNIAGNRSAEANVIVHVPPNATIMPINTSVVEGQDASFFCQFRGNPPPIVSWKFSHNQGTGDDITNSTHFVHTKTELHIRNVTEEDKGWFTCVGRNDAGLMNLSAYLNVFVPASLITRLSDVTVNESDTVTMTCSGYGNPEPTISWLKNGSSVVLNSKTTMNHGTLQLMNVVGNDSGSYSCNARNEYGNETSTAYLTVQVSPTIHAVLGLTRVQWKSKTWFQCLSEGVPKPDIVWLKDGVLIRNTSRVAQNDNRLIIKTATHNDTGNYTCVASNDVGSSKKTKPLIVEVPPDHPTDLEVHNSSSTSLHVLWKPGFDGYSPIISFRVGIKERSKTWQNVSDSVVGLGYTISNLRPYIGYDIRVFAKNKIGRSEASEEITAFTDQDFPSPPVNLSCVVYNATAVHLGWSEPTTSNGVLSQYMIRYKRHDNLIKYFVKLSFLQSIISRLDIFTVYDFQVQASTKNSTLWGNFTSYVSCKSGEAAPDVAPQNVRLTSIGPQTILVSWEVQQLKLKLRYQGEWEPGTFLLHLILPTSANGIVRKYIVRCKKITEDNYLETNIAGNQTTELNVTGLEPWTEYVVQVAAVTIRRGPWSTERTSRTLESVPSGPPTNITVKGKTSHSLMVSWDAPVSSHRHGIIIGYTLMYIEDHLNTSSVNITTNKTMIRLSGLSIFTKYIVQVSAATSLGHGPFSTPTVATTLESYPGLVRDVSKTMLNDSILVKWTVPDTPNGIIRAYNVRYSVTITRIVQKLGTNITTVTITTFTRNVTTHVTNIVLDGIPGNVTYSLCVAARTSVGYGQCTSPIIFNTNFSQPLTREPPATTPVFIPSIVDDHLPLIAGIATVLVVMVIILLVCFVVRRKNRKNEEEQAKRRYNFRGHTFTMSSYGDGESSVASHGSKPIDAYSEGTGSVHRHTNASNAYAAPIPAEGRDQSPLVRLRNSSLHLGSDASSYDEAYSSVAEIGMDPSSVVSPHASNNVEVHAAINKLYADLHPDSSAGDTSDDDDNTSLDSIEFNPIYAPPIQRDTPQDDDKYTMRPSGESNVPATTPHDVDLSQNAPQSDKRSPTNHEQPFAYEHLILPPPPVVFSEENEYSTPEPFTAYTNQATDF